MPGGEGRESAAFESLSGVGRHHTAVVQQREPNTRCVTGGKLGAGNKSLEPSVCKKVRERL